MKRCRDNGPKQSRPTFSLKKTIAADPNQDIKMLSFTLNSEACNKNADNNTTFDGDKDETIVNSPGGVFSHFNIPMNDKNINKKGNTPPDISEEETFGDGTVTDILDDSERMVLMNFEVFTEQYLSTVASNMSDGYNTAAISGVNCSQSVIISLSDVSQEEQNVFTDDHDNHVLNIIPELDTLPGHTYLDKVTSNDDAFNVEDLFHDQTIDDRFLNTICSHSAQSNEYAAAAQDLLMVPTSCWWTTESPSRISTNNNDIPTNGKALSQTVIKNVCGGEIKDVNTL